MNKYFWIAILSCLLLVYLFFYLGIELDLKSVIERYGVRANQLIDTSFRIRKFATIQLALFITVLIACIYLTLKKSRL